MLEFSFIYLLSEDSFRSILTILNPLSLDDGSQQQPLPPGTEDDVYDDVMADDMMASQESIWDLLENPMKKDKNKYNMDQEGGEDFVHAFSSSNNITDGNRMDIKLVGGDEEKPFSNQSKFETIPQQKTEVSSSGECCCKSKIFECETSKVCEGFFIVLIPGLQKGCTAMYFALHFCLCTSSTITVFSKL